MKKIGFGRGYVTGQWYLPGTPFSLLPSPPLDGMPPAATAIDTTYTSLKVGAVYGGAVAISNTTFAGKAAVMFDVTATWDSVKNAAYFSDQGGNVVFNGFTQVDAVLKGGSVMVDAVGVKRANIVTDSGNDIIRIETLDNLTYLAGHEIRVLSGAGNDNVTIAPTDIAARLAAGDITYLPPDGGTLSPDGYQQTTYTDLGDGNDRFTGLGMTADWVFGGAGNDSIQAGGGRDTLAGGSGKDLFVFGQSDGYDELMDFNPGNAPATILKTTVTFAPGPGLVELPIPGVHVSVPQTGYGAPGLDWKGVFVGVAAASLAGTGISSEVGVIGLNAFGTPYPGFSVPPDISAPLGMDLLQLRVYLGDAFGRLGTVSSMDHDGFTILGMKSGVVVAQKDVGLPSVAGKAQVVKFDASWKGIDEISFSRLDGLAIIDDLMATVNGPPTVIGVTKHIDFTSMDGVTELLSPTTGVYKLPAHYGAADLTWGSGIGLFNVPTAIFGNVGLLDSGTAADRSISGKDISLYGLTLKGIDLNGASGASSTVTVEGLIDGIVVAHVDLNMAFTFGPLGIQAFTFDDYSGFRNLDSIRFSGNDLNAGSKAIGIDDLDLRVAPATRSDGFDKLQLLGLNAAQVQDVIDHALQDGSDLLLSYGSGSVLTLHNVDKAELTLNDFLIA